MEYVSGNFLSRDRYALIRLLYPAAQKRARSAFVVGTEQFGP